MGNDKELVDEKIKEMFSMGYCVGGNYEGYKKAILEGIKIGRKSRDNWTDVGIDFDEIQTD